MNNKLKQIGKLSKKLIHCLCVFDKVTFEESQNSVFEIIKEHMNPKNPSIEDCNECIQTLTFLIRGYNS